MQLEDRLSYISGMKGIEKDARLVLTGKVCECSDVLLGGWGLPSGFHNFSKGIEDRK